MSGASLAPRTQAARLILIFAVCATALAMGLRQSFGLFLAPMTEHHGWTASGFGLAVALQVLLNGVFQPLAGQLADRYGGRMVVMSGAALYCVGILGMALAPSLPVFTMFAGVVMGVAVSAAGFPVIVASLTRLLPAEQRGRAVGLGTAGSSFGQFAVVPLSGLMIDGFGWQAALFGMAALSLLMLPLALPLNDRPPVRDPNAAPEQTAREALSAAFRSRSFWCLFAGFFVCGLHVSFLTLHLPAFAASCHLPLYAGAGAISLIGLFNIAGSMAAGELTQRWRARELLVCIYTARGVLMAGFLFAPKTVETLFVFAALMGLLWLSTVPPTVALCARNFGTRWLATIFGLVFAGHQTGGFVGAWLGGVIFDRTGSYDLMWVVAILGAAFAALIHLPVNDPTRRPAVA